MLPEAMLHTNDNGRMTMKKKKFNEIEVECQAQPFHFIEYDEWMNDSIYEWKAKRQERKKKHWKPKRAKK